MSKKWIAGIAIALVLGVVAFFMYGFGPTPKADLSKTESDLSTFSVDKHVQLVGVGEGSHGSKEYQELKGELFKALVEHNDARTFAIEGDFGGSLVVNEYIHGGEGTANDAAAAIGFAIYRTKEMESIIEWMREYNQSAPEGKDLRFMGFDFQRVDASKAYIYKTLEKGAPDLVARYKPTLDVITDDNRLSVSPEDLTKIKDQTEALMKDMDAKQQAIVEASSEDEFAYARAATQAINQYAQTLMVPDAEYNAIRDPFMRDNVKWLLAREQGRPLFINGHNGHLQKVETSGYTPLGKLLGDEFGDKYFAVGVDALKTGFNAQTDTGFEALTVSVENGFTGQLKDVDQAHYYVDFAKVKDDEQWQKIITSDQAITAANVMLASWQTFFPPFFAIAAVPNEAFDAMVIYKEVTPTTLSE